jgi:enoyl-CoA hydratase/carnithine racemase
MLEVLRWSSQGILTHCAGIRSTKNILVITNKNNSQQQRRTVLGGAALLSMCNFKTNDSATAGFSQCRHQQHSTHSFGSRADGIYNVHLSKKNFKRISKRFHNLHLHHHHHHYDCSILNKQYRNIGKTKLFSSSTTANVKNNHGNHNNYINNSNTINISKNKRVIIQDLGDGIFDVQLNRPQKLNSLDIKMFFDIGETLSIIQRNYKKMNIRCIILSGNGRAFCTGLDVPSMIKPSGESDGMEVSFPHQKMNRLLQRPSGYDIGSSIDDDSDDDDEKHDRKVGIGNLAQDVAFLWRTIPIPVISVLHGMCFGGGMQIALGTDIRIAASDCKLSIMEAKWGLIPDMSASITLRELVPIDVAKELTFTGRIINGVEAKQLGLVTKCIEESVVGRSSTTTASDEKNGRDIAMNEAMKLAKDIVKQSPDAIAAAKVLYQRAWIDSSEEQCLDLESRLQKKLLPSWNQFVASTKQFGVKLSYTQQKDWND